MRTQIERWLTGAVWLGVAVVSVPHLAHTAISQQPSIVTVPAQEQTEIPPTSDQTANEVRAEFLQLLRSHPATVSQVLRIDPSLMLNDEFMAPYPRLSAYIADHPEIPRNPTYFVGASFANTADSVLEGVFAFAIILTVIGVLIWLIKTLIDYRRWSRLSRVQTEVHSKLLDRFTNIDDLQAYFSSAAGRRFLESPPIHVDVAGIRAAPSSRILWSVQVGVILTLAGSGLHLATRNISEPDAAEVLRVFGTLAIALGIGFMLSSLASLILSKRLGLLRAPEDSAVRPN